MLNTLKKICQENKFVSVFLNSSNNSKFIYGRPLCVNERFSAIYMLDLSGRYDGILVHRTEDISRIEMDDLYKKKMDELSKIANQASEPCHLDEEHIVESLLQVAQKKGKIVSIEIRDSGYDDVVGFIKSLTSNLCIVKKINEYGMEDGKAIMEIQNITQVSYESESEIIIEKLFNCQHLTVDNQPLTT